MIVLVHPKQLDRVFLPNGEAWQTVTWEALGYMRWPIVEKAISELPTPSFVDPAPVESVDFATAKNITPEMRDILYSRNILNWEDVLMKGVVAIVNLEIDGLGMARARALFAAAQREAD